MNALIIETAFLGDAIISLSLSRAIKNAEPDANVTYVVRPGVEEVLRASSDVTHVMSFDKHGTESGIPGIRKKAEELNAIGYDTLFLLHGSRRSQSLASLIQSERKIGFEAMPHATLTHRVPDAGWCNRYERAALLLRGIIPDAPLTALPRIVPPRVPIIEEFVSHFEYPMVLAPGSAWETKKWGDEKYFELAKKLTEKGIGVLVIGGETERGVAERIREVCAEGAVLALAGNASFLESMDAIARSRLLVANDSAPVHAAVAVGTNVLVIFGPTVPAFGFAPPLACGEVIERSDVWCRPCTPHGSHVCPIYTHECMSKIDVPTVLDRIRKELPEAFPA